MCLSARTLLNNPIRIRMRARTDRAFFFLESGPAQPLRFEPNSVHTTPHRPTTFVLLLVVFTTNPINSYYKPQSVAHNRVEHMYTAVGLRDQLPSKRWQLRLSPFSPQIHAITNMSTTIHASHTHIHIAHHNALLII